MADQSARKRQKGLQGQPIDISLAQQPANAPLPALALFPSTQPPAKTPFSLFTPSGDANSADSRGARAVLAAETDEIEFESRNHIGRDANGEDDGYSVQYMLGVRNPRTNTLTLHAAPLHTFTPAIKSLKGASSSESAAALYTAQRAALGSAFGTKKAQAQQRAQERNKLNSASFGSGAHVAGLQSHLQETIASASSTLPSAEDVENDANARRPIPPFDASAATPNEVYDLSAVVSPAELSAVDLSAYISAPDFRERRQLLPYRRSDWVSTKLRQLLPARASADGAVPDPSRRDRDRLRLVLHVAYLLAFRQAARPGAPVDRAQLVEKLGRPGGAVVDALLERYTDRTRGAGGEEVRKVTSTMELKLLAYLLVVVLKVDGWSTDVTVIADDLGMGNKRVQELFRSLGCVLLSPSSADREKLVAQGRATSAADAAKSKKAVLRVPLQFPKERRGRAKK
ncbi:DNA-directed RNA polymerase I subunit rpa49 [Rhodotorula kratochvilovae]